MKVCEDNGNALVTVNGGYKKYCCFSSNEFWNKIGCLFSAPTFGLGGSRIWKK